MAKNMRRRRGFKVTCIPACMYMCMYKDMYVCSPCIEEIERALVLLNYGSEGIDYIVGSSMLVCGERTHGAGTV